MAGTCLSPPPCSPHAALTDPISVAELDVVTDYQRTVQEVTIPGLSCCASPVNRPPEQPTRIECEHDVGTPTVLSSDDGGEVHETGQCASCGTTVQRSSPLASWIPVGERS
jgi:hypothetical protein